MVPTERLLINLPRRHGMKKNKLFGFNKTLCTLRVKIHVALYFFRLYLKNKELRRFYYILRRLNYFIGKLTHNKFVQIGDNIRFDMYIPGYPSRAFFTACKKFSVFHEKLPCTVALVSVTSACIYHCAHCYQRFDIGKDVDLDTLISAVEYLQDNGIAFFNIEGGEPFMTFERLLALCSHIDDRSEIWINSTGYGINKARLRELKKKNLTAIMFSLHSYDQQTLNDFMGSNEAWQTMENAINLCHEEGIAVAFNSCIPLVDFKNGNFEKLMQKAKEFKAILVQIIKPKPSGAWLESGVEKYTTDDFALIKKKVNQYNLNKEFVDYPAISAQIIEEDPEMFGCTAGGTDRLYINAKGDVQPCEFLNVSFGNIKDDSISDIYQNMRKIFEIPQNCIACEKYASIIFTIFRENNLRTLPLTKDLSQKIFHQMYVQSPTRLYQKIEKELK